MELLNPPDISHLKAIRHGIQNEPKAIEKFEKLLNVTIEPCGLIVHPAYPFLGASPDGKFRYNGEDFLLEIKSPLSAYQKPLTDSDLQYINKSGEIDLKTNDPYFSQIQGQLACSNYKSCYFVVYTGEIKMCRIDRDDAFIDRMLFQLRSFFEKYFKAAILNRYFFRT